ncbi:MAG: type II toxin-antitoxin system prevent-host-death family antitoxin [Chloroflexota bacterium]
MDVAIRELKAHLSEYLERVEQGEVIIVTNRGRRVARITPEPGPSILEQGLREGWLTRGTTEPPRPPRPIQPKPGTPDSTELIRADRDA